MASIQRLAGESYTTYQERRKLVAVQRKLGPRTLWAHRVGVHRVTGEPVVIGRTYHKNTHGPL